MNGRASIEAAAGLTLPAPAVTTGNVTAAVETRGMPLWHMAALLLLSAPAHAGKRLAPGAQGTWISALEQAFCTRSSWYHARQRRAWYRQGPEERRARVRERRVPSRRDAPVNIFALKPRTERITSVPCGRRVDVRPVLYGLGVGPEHGPE